MSHRHPGAGSTTGAGPARQRFAVSLGGADGVNRGDGSGGGLLGIPAPRVSAAAAPPETRSRGGAADAAVPDARLVHGRSGSPGPLSARYRNRTGRRAAVLIGFLAAVLNGFFWWQAAAGTPAAAPLQEVSAPIADQPPVQGGDTAAAGANPEVGQGIIIVHVAGAVAMPGIVQLALGSRLHEAIAAAGGGTDAADPDRLNLASVLEDGQKILVPARGDPGPAESPGETGGPGGSGPAEVRKIDLNTAGVEELGTLPRVGPVLAQRIVDWRTQHGRFKAVEELDAVDGVGPKLLAALLPLVRV